MGLVLFFFKDHVFFLSNGAGLHDASVPPNSATKPIFTSLWLALK